MSIWRKDEELKDMSLKVRELEDSIAERNLKLPIGKFLMFTPLPLGELVSNKDPLEYFYVLKHSHGKGSNSVYIGIFMKIDENTTVVIDTNKEMYRHYMEQFKEIDEKTFKDAYEALTYIAKSKING